MRMHYPQELELDLADEALAGTILEVRGISPLTGTAVVELVCRRDQLRQAPPARYRYENSPQLLTSFQTTYVEANDKCWSRRSISVTEGEFLTAVKIPIEARGDCHVRMFLSDEAGRQYALSSRSIHIATPRTAALPVRVSLQDRAHDAPATTTTEVRR